MSAGSSKTTSAKPPAVPPDASFAKLPQLPPKQPSATIQNQDGSRSGKNSKSPSVSASRASTPAPQTRAASERPNYNATQGHHPQKAITTVPLKKGDSAELNRVKGSSDNLKSMGKHSSLRNLLMSSSQDDVQAQQSAAENDTEEDPFSDAASIDLRPKVAEKHPVNKALVQAIGSAASSRTASSRSRAPSRAESAIVMRGAIGVMPGAPLSYDQMAVKVVIRVRNVIPKDIITVQNTQSRPATPASDAGSVDSVFPDGSPKLCMALGSSGISNRIDITDPKGEKGEKTFYFDTVFGMEVSQYSIYETAVQPLIQKCLEGYNGCIFAYGQTASGKTHTMTGPSQRIAESLKDDVNSLHPDIGIISRVVHQLNSHVKCRRGQVDQASGNCVDFVVKASYLEIYNEELVDLLVDKDKQENLKIRMEPGSTSGKDLYVQNLSERYINSLQDYRKILETGAKNRSVGSTNMNEASSRSHAILTITVDQYLVQPRKTSNNPNGEWSRSGSTSSLSPEIVSMDEHSPEVLSKIGMGRKRSKIHLIDLAGSERADSTGATGTRLKEGAQINQSLSALGNVISALTSAPSSTKHHIPYRDSKLTYLLSDSLGGNALTLMITCCSPTTKNYPESLSTLRFAERVKKVVNKAVINMDPYLLRISELESEILRLTSLLRDCTCNVEQKQDSCEKCEILQRQVDDLSRKAQKQAIRDTATQTDVSSSHTMHSQTQRTPWWSNAMISIRSRCGCGTSRYRQIGIEEHPVMNTYKNEKS